MDSKNKFNIQFAGLKDGQHEFTYQIGKALFERFNYTELEDADVELELMLYKQTTMLTLCFGFVGNLKVLCDRCAEPYFHKVMINNKLYIKFGEEEETESDEIVMIPENSSEIDISHFIYEFITLALPAKRVHKKGDCDPVMLEKLESMTVKKETTDPRWDALKELKIEQ